MWIKLRYIILPLFIFVALGCSKQEPQTTGVDTEEVGEISLQLKSDDSGSLTSGGDTNEYAVSLYRYSTSGEAELIGSWDSFASMDNPYVLPVADYRVDVSCGDNPSFGFEMPYYAGSQEFTLTKDQELDLQVTAYLANSAMSVNFSPSITDSYDDYWVEAVTEYTVESGVTTPAIFTKDETRTGYFKPATITSYVMLVPKGEDKVLYYRLDDIDAQPQESYTITLSTQPGETALTVTLDESLNDRSEELTVPYFEMGYDISVTLPVISSSTVGEVSSSALALQSYTELTEATLTIDSAAADILSLEQSYDLVNLTTDQSLLLELSGITIIVSDGNSRVLAWVQDMLNKLPEGSYSFSIYASDTNGESIEKEFTLTIG